MDLMGGSTIFRDFQVFDPDHIPEEFLYRDSQLSSLALALKPSINGIRPSNCVCLGPPATGKTTAVKILLRELDNFDGVVPVYVNCQLVTSKQQIFAKIYEKIAGHELPSYGIPFVKVYDAILEKLAEDDSVLVVALDDVNTLLSDIVLNDVLYALLKAYEERPQVKIGIICITTDIRFGLKLDPRVSSVFHPVEVFFPIYSKMEMSEILKSRVRRGFYPNAISSEAFEMVVELAYEEKDVRYGMFLLKLAGLEAEARGASRIELRDVEAVWSRSRVAFIDKCLRALDSYEKLLLALIYSSGDETASALFKKFRRLAPVGYTTFNKMLYKLETLRFIDVLHHSNRRIVLKRFDPQIILDATGHFTT